jgi:predicted SnoaL-like aldol condensation-catalyzing enzyme
VSEARKVALEFFEVLLIKKDPATAARRFIGPAGYIQHNPTVPTGPADGFVASMSALFDRYPKWSTVIKRVIAEGDLVAVHHHVRQHPDDTGFAVVDIFRVDDGKLIEHWDVIQPVPTRAANDNTMF